MKFNSSGILYTVKTTETAGAVEVKDSVLACGASEAAALLTVMSPTGVSQQVTYLPAGLPSALAIAGNNVFVLSLDWNQATMKRLVRLTRLTQTTPAVPVQLLASATLHRMRSARPLRQVRL